MIGPAIVANASGGKSVEEARRPQSAMDVRHAGADELPEDELATVL
jgi:hypothetical protein